MKRVGGITTLTLFCFVLFWTTSRSGRTGVVGHRRPIGVAGYHRVLLMISFELVAITREGKDFNPLMACIFLISFLAEQGVLAVPRSLHALLLRVESKRRNLSHSLPSISYLK